MQDQLQYDRPLQNLNLTKWSRVPKSIAYQNPLRTKIQCARPLMAQPFCKVGALHVQIEKAVVLIIEQRVNFYKRHVHFRGRVYILCYHMF